MTPRLQRPSRLRKPVALAILFITVMIAAMWHPRASAAEALVVPSYFYPDPAGSSWNRLNTAASRVATTAILNPNSGPGTTVDSNYLAVVNNLHAAGGKVIGYVSTVYGTRNINDVVADINRYIAFYPVDGFFIDEMTSGSDIASLQYYQSVYNTIKGLSPNYNVMGNPGTSVPEQYASLPVADQFVVFEDSYRNYRSYLPPAWQANYPASRFVNIVYGATKAQMTTAMQFASSHHIGGMFVTSATLPDPYGVLPGYWADEVAAAASAR